MYLLTDDVTWTIGIDWREKEKENKNRGCSLVKLPSIVQCDNILLPNLANLTTIKHA